MAEQSENHIGIEDKIVHIVKQMRNKYPLGKYEMAFHLDNYKGEAFYDRVIESIEDVGGFRIRFTDKSTMDVPISAMKDWDKPNFVDKWGEIIYKTKR